MSFATPHDAEEPGIESLLGQMTVEEKVSLLAGAGMWETPAIERLGIPAFRVSDGPNGARGSEGFVGGTVTSAAFPAGIALAATWDPARVAEIGGALGEEALAKGARLLLGPTVNIHRSPLNGRNFECYSEDPYLASRIAVGYIRGLQEKGVGATVKHFVLNDSEFQRNTISVEADERTQREIYLAPFYAAVREAQTWALMTAYNKIDGVFAGENTTTIRQILKDEWEFDGLVMSDWFGTHSTVDAITAGLDLEMPGPSQWRGEKLIAAMKDKSVSIEIVNDAVRRILHTMVRTGTFDRPDTGPEKGIDRPEHRALIRSTGAESIVLLRNEDQLLPLKASTLTKVAVIGPNAQKAQIMGGGSAQINAHYAISPWAALEDRLGQSVELSFAEGATNIKRLPLLTESLMGSEGLTFDFYGNTDLRGDVAGTIRSSSSEQMWFGPPVPDIGHGAFSARISAAIFPTESGIHTFSLTSAGLSRLSVDGALLVDNWAGYQSGDYFFGLGSAEQRATIELDAGTSHTLTVEYRQAGPIPIRAVRIGYLPPVDPDAIAKAARIATAADVALVFVGLNGEWDGEGQDRPGLELPGNQDELIAAVAAANPKTIVILQSGGPVSMPWLGQIGALIEAWYPGQECGNAITDILFGAVNPSAKLPQTFPVRIEDNPAYLNYPGENGHVHYGERFYVGYRWYEARGIAPLFPFGFGLSYTSFSYGDISLNASELGIGDTIRASVTVTNTGDVAGAEVVQLYIEDSASTLSRPRKELKGFQKIMLEPGAAQTVSFTVDRASLAAWDDGIHAWRAEAGEFVVHIGASSADIRTSASFTLLETDTFLHP